MQSILITFTPSSSQIYPFSLPTQLYVLMWDKYQKHGVKSVLPIYSWVCAHPWNVYLLGFIYFYVYICVPTCSSVHHTQVGARRGEKRVSDPLEMGITGSCTSLKVSTGNQPQSHWKSSKESYLLSHSYPGSLSYTCLDLHFLSFHLSESGFCCYDKTNPIWMVYLASRLHTCHLGKPGQELEQSHDIN